MDFPSSTKLSAKPFKNRDLPGSIAILTGYSAWGTIRFLWTGWFHRSTIWLTRALWKIQCSRSIWTGNRSIAQSASCPAVLCLSTKYCKRFKFQRPVWCAGRWNSFWRIRSRKIYRSLHLRAHYTKGLLAIRPWRVRIYRQTTVSAFIDVYTIIT